MAKYHDCVYILSYVELLFSNKSDTLLNAFESDVLFLWWSIVSLFISNLMLSSYKTVDVLKFQTLISYPKQSRQTAQTQIRLLLKKQSDLGHHCLLF